TALEHPFQAHNSHRHAQNYAHLVGPHRRSFLRIRKVCALHETSFLCSRKPAGFLPSQDGRAGARSIVGCAAGRSSARVEPHAVEVGPRPMMQHRYIGLDVHRATITVAIADHDHAPTTYGTIANDPNAVHKLM